MKNIILIYLLLLTGPAYADIGQQLKQKSDEVSQGIVTSVAQKEKQTSERIKLQLEINVLRNKISSARPEEKVVLENKIKKLERLKSQL
ncbi:hypothetical protein U2T19_004875 [Salmonella enterica]|nr:hypothetical protein [Salmonella enterica]ECF8135105.1 hypothetical protein [Salmonella enterica]EGI1955504.1 hypothetical protein [Salmonella enterica]EMA3598528.1 hypothetical protein [Salmonella enterica]